VFGVELVQGPEDLRVEPGDEVEDAGLDVVQVGRVGKLREVALRRTLLEPGECPLDLDAVVGLVLVPGDSDPGAVDVHRVPDPGERLLERLRLGRQRPEAVRLDVAVEIAPERLEAPRAKVEGGERRAQRAESAAVGLRRVEEPALLLVAAAEVLRLRQVQACPPHLLRERADALEHRGLLEVAQDFVPIPDGGDLVQRRAEERRQVVLLALGGHRLEHLVEIQVAEEVWLLALGRAAVFEEDALEGVLSCAVEIGHGLPPVVQSVEAISRSGGSGGLHRLSSSYRAGQRLSL
jgi:hypothetical protein